MTDGPSKDAHDQGAPDLPQTPWWSTSWQYRRKITVTKTIGATLADFPLLVTLTDAGLTTKARSDGFDFAFTASDGTTKLAHEIERFDSTVGTLVAWVKIPQLSTGTIVYLYYGNPKASDQQQVSAVWSNGYLGVWHFHSAPPQLTDSSSPAYPGATKGGMASASHVAGKIGQAYKLDGIDDKIVADFAALRPTGAFTVSAWFWADAADTSVGDDELVSTQGVSGDWGWDLSFDEASSWAPCRAVMLRTSPDGKALDYVGWEKVCPGTWQHVVGIYKPSTLRQIFVDGVLTKQVTTGVAAAQFASKAPFTIGAEAVGGGGYFMGLADEVRLSSVARSAQWIAATHANQGSPATFYVIGAEQLP